MEATPIRRPAKKTELINLKKPELAKKGYSSLSQWLTKSEHVYIGREMNYPHCTVAGSKWGNPFSVQKYGRDKCLELYEQHLRKGELYGQVEELDGKVLGCWCYPEPCHGNILIKVLEEKKAKKQ